MRQPLRPRFPRLVSLVGVASLAACGAEAPEHASRRDCERLRDHTVELRMAAVTADHDQHRAAIESAVAGLVATCIESTTPEQLRCSLAAADFAALAACTTGGTP